MFGQPALVAHQRAEPFQQERRFQFVCTDRKGHRRKSNRLEKIESEHIPLR